MVIAQLPIGSRNLGHRRHRWSSCMGRTKPIVRSGAAPPDGLPEPSGHVRMTNMLVMRLVSISVLLLAFSDLAEAADHGQFGPTSPDMKAWANSLENKLKEGCCSTADGWKPEEVEYDMKDNKYRVKIEGEWYDVPPGRSDRRAEQIRLPCRLVL